MTKRIPIPIVAEQSSSREGRLRPPPSGIVFSAGQVNDRLNRPLRDLRLSVIDQCNLRCRYCMPREVFNRDYEFLPREALLSFDAMEHLVRASIPLGVRKLRITGGEPLLRKGLTELIARLSRLQTLENAPLEIALTTNGVLLKSLARPLAEAGLHRVTVSLDALSPQTFQAMADAPDIDPRSILEGIEAAEAAGLAVKVNMVVQRGVNEHEILPMARHFRHRSATLRFIEFMDVGSTNHWSSSQVVSSATIIGMIANHHPLRRVGRSDAHEVSERWAYADGAGQIGLISSISEPFCRGCSRARISAEGGFYTCLFADQGTDLRPLVDAVALGAPLLSAEGLQRSAASLAALWQGRTDRYSELRWQQSIAEHRIGGKTNAPGLSSGRVEMSYIGG